MLFQIDLWPTTATPDRGQLSAAMRAEIAAELRLDANAGVVLTSRDGARFRFGADRATLFVERLSPGLCRAIFQAALKSNATVHREGSDVTPLKMRGSSGDPLFGEADWSEPIASPKALCVRLQANVRDWNRSVRQAQKIGLMDADGQPLQPPAAPGAEPRLASDPSGTAAKCQAAAERMDGKLTSTLVTRHRSWGVVWRADMSMAEAPDVPFRYVCWRLPHSRDPKQIVFAIQPLQMFDPKASVPPLSGD